MIPIVQLSHIGDITHSILAHETPIWKVRLWIANYEKKLNFLPEATKYNNKAIKINSVIIDFIDYLNVSSYEVLRNKDCTWMFDPIDSSVILIHFKDHGTPFKKYSIKKGAVLGFSKGAIVELENAKTYPILQTVPDIKESSDIMRYQKMTFNTGTITIDNSTGMLDDLWELYGNDVFLHMYSKKNGLELVYRYFIENYTLGLNEAVLSVKDIRSRLNFKCPNTYYTGGDDGEYKYIDDNIIGKIKQDAYGYCRGVPGVCLNNKQVYQEGFDGDTTKYYDWFHYRFARKITSIEEVWVEDNNEWKQVYPNLGHPDEKTFLVNSIGIRILKKLAAGIYELVTVTDGNKDNLPDNDGVIAIFWKHASEVKSGLLERRGGNAFKAKMTGTFVNKNTPLEIIKDIMEYYGGVPYVEANYDTTTFEAELTGQPEIGLFMDSAQSVYDWIEKIQNGGRDGFQLLIKNGLYSVRLDDPNRVESFNIRYIEIKNKESLTPEYEGENYATFTTINYSKDHTDGDCKTLVDRSFREKVLDIYMSESEYELESLLVNEEDIIIKSKNILENSSQIRPIIRGIELNGLRPEIELYSTGFIDFSYQLPRQMKSIQLYMKKRNFMGLMRVKVIALNRNIENETLTIDVVQCDKLGKLYCVNPELILTGTRPFEREVGEEITTTLTPVWTQNDAGELTQYRLTKNGTNILTNTTAIAYTDTIQLLGNTVYQAYVDYEQGTFNNNSDRIPAGTLTASITYNARRRGFFGVLPDDTIPDNSVVIREFDSIFNPTNNSQMAIDVNPGDKGACFAYPATLREATSIIQQGLNMNVKGGFIKTLVSVEGANGAAPADYHVYYFITEFPFAEPERFLLTI